MAGTPGLAKQRRHFQIAVAVVALLVVAFAILLSPGLDLALRQAASGAGLLVGGVVALLSAGTRARWTTGRRRRSWLLLTTAAVVAVVGNLWVTLRGGDPTEQPSAVSNGTIAVALLLSIAGLLSFPSVRRRGTDLLLMSLDGLVAGSAVLIMASVLVYPQLLDEATDDTATRAAAVAFPVLDVVLATVAILLILRTTGADRQALGFVTAGFLLYAVADLTFSVRDAQGDFEFGTPVDLGWIAGYLLISLAAWYPNEHAEGAAPHVEQISSDSRGTFLVFGVLVAAGLVQVVWGPDGQLTVPQAVLWMVLILAAATRQVLLASDNAALRRGLERRVREQTADLRRLARQNEVLLTSVGDGIYGVDREGRVTFINPSGAAALGHPPEALHGRVAHDLFHAPDESGTPFPREGCYIDDAVRTGTVASSEADVYLRADGGTFPVEITASPLVDDDAVRGAVVVFRDITQRREVDRMKDEFLSVVSHELRTPLTSIRGSLGLLGSGRLGDLPERAGSMVELALQNSERLTRLINDLLDIERIETGSRPMEITVLDAGDLLEAAARAMEGLATTSRVRLEVGPCSGRVLGDEDRLMQTLTNLLGNAVKYSPAEGVVRLRAEPHEEQVRFSVADQGRGIPTDKLETVFRRFEQVDSSDAREKGGTGLGLAISKGIVERLGGRIWAESEPGSGTIVHFTLPAAPSAATAATAATAGSARPSAGARGTLLLVEDDTDLARVLTALLDEAGFDVVHATTVDEAVARGAGLPLRAVVLDLALPDGPGAAVVEGLKSAGMPTETAVVVYSARDLGVDDPEAQVPQARALLTKGRVGPEELRDRLIGILDAAAGDREPVR